MCPIVLLFFTSIYCSKVHYHHISPCFFFSDTATTEIYTLSLHDALPILRAYIRRASGSTPGIANTGASQRLPGNSRSNSRSEEHTSELQSLTNLVCRLLLEKKNKKEATLYIDNNERMFNQQQ